MPERQLDVLLILKDKFSAAINTVQTRMGRMAKFVRNNWLGVTAATFAFQRALRGLVGPAIEFESAFAGVRKTVDATEEEFKQLNKGLIEMSKRIPVAAKDLARIQELAGQLGIKGVKDLEKFTESISKITVSTNLSQESAAINFSRIASVIQEPIENIDKMASSVVALGNNFEVQEDEILTFAQRIAAMGKLSKLTSADIFGVGAAFASVGVQAEAGGTAVNKVLLELAKQGKTGRQALVDFVEELQEAGDQAGQKLEELGFNEARTQRAFLSLAGAGDKLKDALSLSNDEFERANALNEEAEKRFATTASKIQLIKNNIASLTIEIGNKLLPVFERFLVLTKQYVDFATGVDLVQTNLQVLESGLDRITKIIEDRQNSIANFNPLISKQYKEETLQLERQRTALVGLIQEEKARIDRQSFNQLPIQGPQLPEGGLPGSDALAEEKNKAEERAKFIKDNMEDIQRVADDLSQKLSRSFSDPLAAMISGAVSAKEAFAQMGKSLVSVISNFIAETLVAFTIGKTIQAVATKLGIAQASVLAAAWAPAATLANIATFGGASAAGAAGMTAAFGTTTGLALAQRATLSAGATFHEGGVIRGRAASDVPIIAQAGEGVLSRKGMAALGGEGPLNDLNRGRTSSSGGVNVNIFNPRFNNKEDIKELTNLIGVEIDRQLRYAKGF